MLANRLAREAGGISYPYLYLNSAASDCARMICERPSAVKGMAIRQRLLPTVTTIVEK